MMDIEARIYGHSLALVSAASLPTGSIDVDRIYFSALSGDEWSNCATITAQFWHKASEIYEAEIENAAAVIPQEVLSGVGLLHIAVYGTDSGGTTRISTNTVTLPITQGSFSEASAPAPSSSMFEQAVSAAVEEVKDEILAPNAVDNEILSDMPPMTVKGNNTNQTGDPKDITADDFRTMFEMVGASAQRNGRSGFVPRPAAGDGDKFLAGDGTFKTPPGGGGGSSAETTNDITIRLPSRPPVLGTVSDGDVLTLAMAQINNLVSEVTDLAEDKLDTNGDGNEVTAQRNASVNFSDIPLTPITLQALLNTLGGWYAEINGKYAKPEVSDGAPDETTKGEIGGLYLDENTERAYLCTGSYTELGAIKYIWNRICYESPWETIVDRTTTEAEAAFDTNGITFNYDELRVTIIGCMTGASSANIYVNGDEVRYIRDNSFMNRDGYDPSESITQFTLSASEFGFIRMHRELGGIVTAGSYSSAKAPQTALLKVNGFAGYTRVKIGCVSASASFLAGTRLIVEGRNID